MPGCSSAKHVIKIGRERAWLVIGCTVFACIKPAVVCRHVVTPGAVFALLSPRRVSVFVVCVFGWGMFNNILVLLTSHTVL